MPAATRMAPSPIVAPLPTCTQGASARNGQNGSRPASGKRQRAEQAAHLQQGLLAAGLARPLDPAQGGLARIRRPRRAPSARGNRVERRRPVPLGEGRDSAQQRQQQMAGAQCGRADQPAGLDEAQRAQERDLDAAPGRGRSAAGSPTSTDEKIERAAVGTEPAQPGLDHRLPGEAGMLDGAADQGQAQAGLAALGQQDGRRPRAGPARTGSAPGRSRREFRPRRRARSRTGRDRRSSPRTGSPGRSGAR